MAICEGCNQEMKEADGCLVNHYNDFVDREPRERIRWGEETMLAVRASMASQQGVESPLDHPLSMDDPKVEEFLKMTETGPFAGRRRCPDCNAKPGEYHHIGCDNEECPRCHLQAFGCACIDESNV